MTGESRCVSQREVFPHRYRAVPKLLFLCFWLYPVKSAIHRSQTNHDLLPIATGRSLRQFGDQTQISGEETKPNSSFKGALRYTLNGNRCILPVLARTEIWTDCIENEYGNPVCEVDDGSWEECEIDGSTNIIKQRQEDGAAPVSTPLGGVCWTGIQTSPMGRRWNLCNAPLVCAAAPIGHEDVTALLATGEADEQQKGAMQNTKPLNLTDGTLGICVPSPQNMKWAPVLEAGGEPPMAFFPITSPSIATWPTAGYLGTSEGVQWEHDSVFGMAMNCRQNELDIGVLQNVAYGQMDGQWAISLWIRPNNTAGRAFQYIYSHSAHNIATWDSNQVQIYLPERAHDAHGVIRVIVKDSTDRFTEGEPQMFLDSDGKIADQTPSTTAIDARQRPNLLDGEWHMVTVSTIAVGVKGFRLFVDGQLAGELSRSALDRALNGTERMQRAHAYKVNGGDYMRIGSEIFLCGRMDLDRDRHFDGSMSQLSLYNRALAHEEIENMYASVQKHFSAYELERGEGGQTSQLVTYSPCSLLQEDNSFECSVGQMCVNASSVSSPTSSASPNIHANQTAANADGVCLSVPPGLELLITPREAQATSINAKQAALPLPYAWFPLNNTLESWPVARYTGKLMGDAKFEADDLWGMALQCGVNSTGLVILDQSIEDTASVPFRSSQLSVNLWLKFNPVAGSVNSDHVFHYLFFHDNSAAGSSEASGPWKSNQVQIFLPSSHSSSHGVARVILRDNFDVNNGNVAFLDSDGMVSYNGARSLPHQDLADREWHMLTVTTIPDGGKGYRIYVDGVLTGELAPGVLAAQPVEITGGDIINLSGPIHLCGRKGARQDRHFPGLIAGVGIWDQALTAGQIRSLWAAKAAEQEGLARQSTLINPNSALQPTTLHPALGRRYLLVATRFSTAGRQCIFPAAASGTVVTDCIAFPPSGTAGKNMSSAESAGWCQTTQTALWEPCRAYKSPIQVSAWVPVANRRTSSHQCILPAVVSSDRPASSDADDDAIEQSVIVDCVDRVSNVSTEEKQSAPLGREQCMIGSGEWKDCLPGELHSTSSMDIGVVETAETLENEDTPLLSKGQLADLQALVVLRRNVIDISSYPLWEAENFEESPCMARPPEVGRERTTIFPSRIVGIGCDADRRIVALSLRADNLTRVPEGVFKLEKLRILDLAHNHLEEINLTRSLADLELLDLRYNRLHGRLDGIIDTPMPRLQILQLEHNSISGSLPSNEDYWLMMPNLTFVDMSQNEITGYLPEAISTLDHLQGLELHNNSLMGKLPFQLPRQLTWVSLANNKISGQIPASWSQLTCLEVAGNSQLCGELNGHAVLGSTSGDMRCQTTERSTEGTQLGSPCPTNASRTAPPSRRAEGGRQQGSKIESQSGIDDSTSLSPMWIALIASSAVFFLLALLLLLLWPQVRTWKGKAFERYTDAAPGQQQAADSDISSSTEMEISMQVQPGERGAHDFTERKDVALIPSTAIMSDMYSAQISDSNDRTRLSVTAV